MVAKSAGDPYVLHTVAMGHAINPLIYKKIPFDAEKDFTPISLIATFPQLVLVHPSVPAQSLKELIELAKRGKPPLNYASGGNGSSQHLAGALFMSMAGASIPHVPYKGGNPALLDLIGGQVSMMIVQPNSRDQITSGKLRALAVSSSKRSRHYPDLPSVSEAGLPGYESVAWYGIVAPRDLPAAVRAKLEAEVAKAIESEAVRSVVDAQGGDLAGGGSAAFARFILAERNRYQEIVRTAGITVD
jgi:tripartite-type tricarboxylate transporter receptor subunit TctC